MENDRTIKVPTTSIFDFERLILDGEAKYVDKTALFYQGGYLTISEVIDTNTFRLGIPNMEIANSLAEVYASPCATRFLGLGTILGHNSGRFFRNSDIVEPVFFLKSS